MATFFAISFFVLFLNIHSLENHHNNNSRWTLQSDDQTTSKHDNKTDNVTTPSDLTTVASSCIESIDANSDNERILRPVGYFLKGVTTVESPRNITTEIPTANSDVSNCTRVYVEPECYEKSDNESVYVPLYNMMFNKADYVIDGQLLFVCANFSDRMLSSKKISEHIPVVSFACAVISSVCLVIYMIIFIAFKEMRNLPGWCMLSLSIALLSAYGCFFIHHYISDFVQCTILGMFILYFFLSSFFWMNTIAYDVWKSIRMATAKLRLSTGRSFTVYFVRYSFYSWGSPLMIIILSIIINYSTDSSAYKLTFNASNCWFEYKQAFVMYFAGPLLVLFAANIFFFISSFFMITDAAESLSQANSEKKSDLLPRLYLTIRLGGVMGFLWVFGIAATLTKIMWLWYLCAAFSGLQGVCILFNFTVSDKLKKAFRNASKRKPSTTATLTTSIGRNSSYT